MSKKHNKNNKKNNTKNNNLNSKNTNNDITSSKKLQENIVEEKAENSQQGIIQQENSQRENNQQENSQRENNQQENMQRENNQQGNMQQENMQRENNQQESNQLGNNQPESIITKNDILVDKSSETKKSDSTSDASNDKSKDNTKFSFKASWLRLLFFPIAFIYMELAFHFYVLKDTDLNIIYPIIFALAYGLILSILMSVLKGKLIKILSFVLMLPVWLFFNLQLVYFNIFKTFISIYSVTQNAGDASEFWKEALDGIVKSLPGIILLTIPAIFLAIAYKKKWIDVENRLGKQGIIATLIAAVVVNIAVPVGATRLSGSDAHSVNDLYHNSFMLDLGIDKMGVMTSTILDFKMVFFSDNDASEDLVFVSLDLDDDKADLLDDSSTDIATNKSGNEQGDNKDLNTSDSTGNNSDYSSRSSEGMGDASTGNTGDKQGSGNNEGTGDDGNKQAATPTPTPLPTPTPIDTSPNVLDIDFEALAENEKNEKIANIHRYMANATPTKKNEYTGMFEGYNLIFLTAEGFSPWAVDEKVTPTLYKLVNNGFVFKNFYTPIWYTSTSDGEYVACTSLIPYSTNSFKRSGSNSMSLCLGHVFNRLGYSSKAWHDHSYTYYGRDKTHPNMGYDFKAKGHGLDITPTWPESDLEMMELTIPEFINEEKFNVYYMTVSGHLEYNFGGNKMASKHKEDVKDLPYSDACKAYIACNMELDLALEYLINELKKAGIADKTVIALSADHYPYGLEMNEIAEIEGHEVEENFELYKNHFILWSGSIKEPIVIDKYCSSLDIVPTLCNLFGIDYDSRLYIGQDILSDAPELVMFSNQSFITKKCKYNSKKREVISFTDEEPSDEYIENAINVVKNKFNISHSILLNNYYKYIEDYLPPEISE